MKKYKIEKISNRIYGKTYNEERKDYIIEQLKDQIEYYKYFPLYKSDAKRLIEIIEKQSKEIEELKMITKEYDSFLGNEKIIIADKSYFDNGYFKEKFISKDKIKARIKELEEYLYRGSIKDDFLMIRIKAKIQELQSLLEKE